MNQFEQCIDEWATRCRDKDAQITSLQTALDAEREKVQTLRDERDRIRAALEVAGDDICSEYCGAGPCHKKCLAVKAALTPAGGQG